MQRLVGLVLVAAVVPLWGCNLFGKVCETSSDCDGNEVCVPLTDRASICVPANGDGGTQDGGSPDGGSPDGGNGDGGTCVDNVACVEGSHWDPSTCTCVFEPIVCQTDQDCPAGDYCAFPAGFICPPNADCAQLKTCQPICELPECPMGFHINTALCRCEPPPPCSCGPGLLCVQQIGGPAVSPGFVPPITCQPPPPGPCNGCACLNTNVVRCQASSTQSDVCVCDNGMR